jgi:putative transposase
MHTPGTYSKMYTQMVFAVKRRESLIHNSWEEHLYKYITGIVQNKDQKMLAINGMPDHIHILIGMEPSCRISDLVREIKKSSNNFINENKFSKFHFNWQDGYGAFTYSRADIDRVIKYIMNQKEHHQKKTFREEYIQMLNDFNIEFDEKYLFEWLE